MKFKTRFDNLLAKIAGDPAAIDIKPKTKDEKLLDATNGLPRASDGDNGKFVSYNKDNGYELVPVPTELPEVSSSDNGKVLGVVEGSWSKASIPTELPIVSSSDNGKMLGVVSGSWQKTSVPTELPTVSSLDDGKILSVVNGNWEKASMPTELPQVTSSDNGKVLSVVEGGWAKANAQSGGSNVLVVTISETYGQSGFTCDKTLQEILTAFENNTPVYGKLKTYYGSNNNPNIKGLSVCTSSNSKKVYFSYYDHLYSDGAYYYTITDYFLNPDEPNSKKIYKSSETMTQENG